MIRPAQGERAVARDADAKEAFLARMLALEAADAEAVREHVEVRGRCQVCAHEGRAFVLGAAPPPPRLASPRDGVDLI